MTPRLKRLELEGFRGFAERRVIDLDADVVVVRGDNGTGKTSLVDGLLWLFCGELAYLAERVRGLRRTEDVLTSRFGAGRAQVTLTVGVADGDRIYARAGDQRSNRLRANGVGPALEGEAAEASLAEAFGLESAEEMRQAVLTWGLLRQDAVRGAIEQAGGALYQRVAGLIGLEAVNGFADATSAAADASVRKRTEARRALAAAEERFQDAIQRRDSAREAAVSEADVSGVLRKGFDAIAAKLPDGIVICPEEGPVDLRVVAGIVDTIEEVIVAVDRLKDRRKAVAANSDEAEKDVERADQAVAQAKEAVAQSTERAPVTVQLASSAMTLLGETCPVCEQQIEEERVRDHLQEMLDSAQATVAEAEQARAALVAAESALARARGALEARRLAIEGLDSARAQLEAVLDAHDDCLRVEVDASDSGRLDELVYGLRTTVTELRGLYRSVDQVSGAHIGRLEDECVAAAAGVEVARQELSSLEARCKRAKDLERDAHSAARSILERALEELRPSFAEVFDRLAPSPAFTELLAKQDVMRNRNQIVPMVRDREFNINANPLLVFSEGQLNVVALSYFLGMALNARDAELPFLVLDDPLQALDVIAILGFSDLCRQIRGRRQLIVTTHDRRFADVMVRKLSPRGEGETLLVHDFEGWARSGPLIRTTQPETTPVIRLLAQAS